jgi:hypothetical protein
VPESSITVFDSSRFIPSNLYDKIHHEFPGVVFVDHIGGDGRVKAEFKPNAIPFSVENNNAKGLDTTVVGAAYLINAAVLRAHVSSGVTLCAKNLFGATSINTDWRKNAHDGFRHDPNGSASHSAFTDFLGHKDLGEKPFFLLLMGSMETTTWMVHLIASGKWRPSTMLGRIAFLCRLTAWRSIPSASIFSLRNGLLFRISRMPITTCANLPWPMILLRRQSMILNATAFDAAALA